jgi:hypothetical protein
VTCALRASVDDPADADALPVSVRVHTIAPEAAAVGALNAPVIPLGKPETMLIFSLLALTPLTGVAVTVTVAMESDCIDTEVGETPSVTPGAGCT